MYRFRTLTLQWERSSLPSQIKADPYGYYHSVDGADNAPASVHSYGNPVFLPILDRYLTFGGSNWRHGGGSYLKHTGTGERTTGPYLFDPHRMDPNKVGGTTGSQVNTLIQGGQMWMNRDLPAHGKSVPSATSGCAAYANEGGKDVVYAAMGYRQLYRYQINELANPANDSFAVVGTNWYGYTDQTTCGYDPKRRLFVYAGWASTPFLYWNVAVPGKEQKLPIADARGVLQPLLSAGTLKLRQCGLDFDTRHDRFRMWCGDGRVWSLVPRTTDPATTWDVLLEVAPSGAVPNGSTGSGILGKWKYVKEYDAFVGLQDSVAGNIWFYKPVGWKL
jgi:hypothetical protein